MGVPIGVQRRTIRNQAFDQDPPFPGVVSNIPDFLSQISLEVGVGDPVLYALGHNQEGDYFKNIKRETKDYLNLILGHEFHWYILKMLSLELFYLFLYFIFMYLFLKVLK